MQGIDHCRQCVWYPSGTNIGKCMGVGWEDISGDGECNFGVAFFLVGVEWTSVIGREGSGEGGRGVGCPHWQRCRISYLGTGVWCWELCCCCFCCCHHFHHCDPKYEDMGPHSQRGRKAAAITVNAPMEDNEMVGGAAVIMIVILVLSEALNIILCRGGNDAHDGNVADGQ